VGTRLDLVLRSRDSGEPLQLPAEVVSVDVARDGTGLGRRGMGLRFLELEPDVQKKLDELYASLDTDV
jgi:c-di-GMP-binding flagellar brake protein YcgR